jgi:integrase
MAHQQKGSIYKRNASYFLKYYTTIESGKRVHKTEFLCSDADARPFKQSANDRRDERTRAKQFAERKRDERMQVINAQQQAQPSSQESADMTIVAVWELYLHHCSVEIVPLTRTTRMKPSTIRGYKQIWNQHLKDHFSGLTLRGYTPDHGMTFLNSLAATQCKNTLKHVRALMCSIFKYAIRERKITGVKVNPIHDVLMPEDAIESDATKHYTLEEAEDIISALKPHSDCQLIMALSCFLGLRPSEIVGLKWNDFDSDSEALHIRRAVVRGVCGTPKTEESIASIPLVDQRVIVPLESWRHCKTRTPSAWVFANDEGGHLHDLGNLTARKIRPALKKAKLEWKGVYSGRRGACTAAVEATGGNYAVAQQLLRHKSMKTTLDFYKKRITEAAFKAGMKQLAAAGPAAAGHGSNE